MTNDLSTMTMTPFNQEDEQVEINAAADQLETPPVLDGGFAFSLIVEGEDTQYRVETNEDRIAKLHELVKRNTKWHTPVRIGKCGGLHYLIDGFHRYAAYKRAGFDRFPEGGYAVEEHLTEASIHIAAMTANLGHGMDNDDADFTNIINKLCVLDPNTYMKNRFAISYQPVMELLTLSRKQAGKYIIPLDKNLTIKRDELIAGMHNDGESPAYIAQELGLSDQTVRDYVRTLKEAEKPKISECTVVGLFGMEDSEKTESPADSNSSSINESDEVEAVETQAEDVEALPIEQTTLEVTAEKPLPVEYLAAPEAIQSANKPTANELVGAIHKVLEKAITYGIAIEVANLLSDHPPIHGFKITAV